MLQWYSAPERKTEDDHSDLNSAPSYSYDQALESTVGSNALSADSADEESFAASFPEVCYETRPHRTHVSTFRKRSLLMRKAWSPKLTADSFSFRSGNSLANLSCNQGAL